MTSSNRGRSLFFGLAALLLALMSAFFIFYTARLFYITRGLQATRPGGQGAYIGAVVFPLLAILLDTERGDARKVCVVANGGI